MPAAILGVGSLESLSTTISSIGPWDWLLMLRRHSPIVSEELRAGAITLTSLGISAPDGSGRSGEATYLAPRGELAPLRSRLRFESGTCQCHPPCVLGRVQIAEPNCADPPAGLWEI